ncbi:MAG: NAD-dependent epimerase/dehydratase family protein [Haloarculaceae archaeon]
MEYFVTGGTGFIGTNVVEQLVEEGHELIVATRSRSNADHLPEAVEVVEADITDKKTLRQPMRGVDGVFHMAAWFYIGPGPQNRGTARRINVEGARTVFELITELDISKGGYTSTMGVFGDTGGDSVDETYRPDDPGLCVYFRTKWRAHYEVAEPMIAAGLPLVVVQPGGVVGPGNKEYSSVRSPFNDWFQGDLPMLPGDYGYRTTTSRIRPAPICSRSRMARQGRSTSSPASHAGRSTCSIGPPR